MCKANLKVLWAKEVDKKLRATINITHKMENEATFQGVGIWTSNRM